MFSRRWLLTAGAFLAAGLSLNVRTSRNSDVVDLNRASVAELMHVPGMTAVWAARIVGFRPYKSKLDLLDRGVVTAGVYQRIRDRVVAHRNGASDASK